MENIPDNNLAGIDAVQESQKIPTTPYSGTPSFTAPVNTNSGNQNPVNPTYNRNPVGGQVYHHPAQSPSYTANANNPYPTVNQGGANTSAPSSTVQPASYTPPVPNRYGYNPNINNSYPYGNPQGYSANQSPANIYNNTPRGDAPQYHYGYGMPTPFMNEAYYKEQQEKQLKRKHAEKKLSKIGTASGLVLLGCFLVSLIFSYIYIIPAVSSFADSSLSFTCIFNMLYSLITVGAAFLLFSKLYDVIKDPALPNIGATQPTRRLSFKTNFGTPKGAFKTFLLIVISFGGCMVANFLSSIILTFLEMVGIHSTYSAIEDPKTISDTILMFLAVAVIPPLIEEVALRGIVMSKLRRYGNAFAIITSAFMFGIFHGTAAQIPFAFICGLFFGYITIATESIWPAIIVHALNNALSCIASVLIQYTDENIANVFYYIISIGGIILAILGVILYTSLYGKEKILSFKGEEEFLPLSQKIKKFILNPAMIAAILIYSVMAIGTLTLS